VFGATYEQPVPSGTLVISLSTDVAKAREAVSRRLVIVPESPDVAADRPLRKRKLR